MPGRRAVTLARVCSAGRLYQSNLDTHASIFVRLLLEEAPAEPAATSDREGWPEEELALDGERYRDLHTAAESPSRSGEDDAHDRYAGTATLGCRYADAGKEEEPQSSPGRGASLRPTDPGETSTAPAGPPLPSPGPADPSFRPNPEVVPQAFMPVVEADPKALLPTTVSHLKARLVGQPGWRGGSVTIS